MKQHLALCFLLSTLFLAACRSSKSLEKPVAPASTEHASAETAFKKKVLATHLPASALSARLNVSLDINEKNLSCNGRLQMKRGALVRISLLLPLIGTEIGRIECTPTEVLIINRFNKEYVRGSYQEVPFLKTAGLDFYALEALLWHELFVPGSKAVLPQLHRFKLANNGAITVLSLDDTPQLNYDFHTASASALLQRTAVRSKNPTSKDAFTFFYDQFTSLANRHFPARMAMAAKYGDKQLGMTLDLSRFSTEANFDLHTEVSNNYTRRSMQEIAKKLAAFSR